MRIKPFYILGLVLILALASGTALAASVTPRVIDGGQNTDKTCAVVFPGTLELKIEPVPDGTYLKTDGVLSVTVVKPSTVTSSVPYSTNSFDWSANIPVEGVIVKDGNDGANVYDYPTPGSMGDTYLTTPNNGAKAISHISFCYYPALMATKTAETSYTRTYEWEITKDYDSEYWKFIGDPATIHDYKVSVDQTVTDSDWLVSGEITVTNPTTKTVTFSVADDVGGVAAAVVCPTYELAPGASTTCTYSAALTGAVNGTNTATITSQTEGVKGAIATKDYAFGEPTTVVGDAEIHITDTNVGEVWTADGDADWEYSKDFTCPTDQKLYVDGYYKFTHKNSATIKETGDSDDADVTVNCYAPVVSKDAKAAYDERHIWDVEKTVDPESQSGYPGDVLDWKWTVTVSETYVEENFEVTGTIYVANPADAPGSIEVVLSDKLDDGTVAVLDCEGTLTVEPGETGECEYTAKPDGRTATKNEVTATFNEINFTAEADVIFDKNVVYGSATLTDDEIGLEEVLTAGKGPWEFTGEDSHTCSSTKADYFIDDVYTSISEKITNWAYLKSGDEELDKDGAETTWTCDAGFMDLLKLTDGEIDPTKTWTFALYEGPDGFGGTKIGESSTLGDEDGVLDFGAPALRPDVTYTVCELGVPAGWTSFWQVDGETVIPYNPDADNSTPEDLGNRCVDFKVTVATTIYFVVDNQHPGGDPRTPGYWKNWNRCTGGGQQYTADANGGWEEGYWLLEDVLVKGIVWDDILIDSFVFPIDSCRLAVSILDNRDASTGKVMASDPLYNLARSLLAAQLNFGAGACTTQDVLDAALAAETLLDKYNFDAVGPGGIPKKDKVDGPEALRLAKYLDEYNNGMYCGSLMP